MVYRIDEKTIQIFKQLFQLSLI